MARLMFDSDVPSALADSRCAGCLVATYADLMTPAIVQQFAGRLVVIDRGRGDPMNLATVADIELGCLTITQGAAKIRQWESEQRQLPTAYHDRNDWSAVDAELTGVAHSTWISTLDGTLAPDGKFPQAVQFAGERTLGFHADVSVVWDAGWHPIGPTVTYHQLAGIKAALVSVQAQVAALH